jgi:2-oxoglutarate ferredoxin oxidoreductase subunit delta
VSTITIDKEKCKGCEICIQACPHDLIVLSPKMNKHGGHYVEGINLDKCTGCTLCARVCPDWVIEVYKG